MTKWFVPQEPLCIATHCMKKQCALSLTTCLTAGAAASSQHVTARPPAMINSIAFAQHLNGKVDWSTNADPHGV
jgi:hypothetical protein